METQTLKWIPVSEALPEIDKSNDWNLRCRVSKDVLAYSKEWGMRFAKYYHAGEIWDVHGVNFTSGEKVEYWMDVPTPEGK